MNKKQQRIQLIRIQRKKRKMQPVPSKVASRVTAPSKAVATTNVTVSGQPLAPPAPLSSTMCTEVTESTDGKPPPQSSSTMCTESTGGQPPPQSSHSAGGQPPPQSSSTMCTQSAGAQPPARPSPSKTGLPFRQVLKVHI